MDIVMMPNTNANAKKTIKVAATIEQQCLLSSRRSRAAVRTSHCSQCTCGVGFNTPAMSWPRDSGSVVAGVGTEGLACS